MDFKQFSKKVDNLIYDNISHESKKIVNNIMNIGFNDFVIQIIKVFKEVEVNLEIYFMLPEQMIKR